MALLWGLCPGTAAAATLQGIVSTYNGYDYNVDGINEIEQLVFLSSRSPLHDDPLEPVDPARKLVLVIVESRLFSPLVGSRYSESDLDQRLARFRSDLAAEGRQARFLMMRDYAGPRIQEGRTVLAIREFFKAVYRNFPNFEGVVLIGSFPDAGIVRNYPQSPPDAPDRYGVGLTAGKPRPNDIVLADLDGNWAQLYHEEEVTLPEWSFKTNAALTVTMVGSVAMLTNATVVHGAQDGRRRDLFWLNDASFTIYDAFRGHVRLNLANASPEATAQDRLRPNPIARPEIAISRINPRLVAVQPPSPALVNSATGKPQPLPYDPLIGFAATDWRHDDVLERTLLIEYLDLNHGFRAGRFAANDFSVSLAWCDIGPGAGNHGLMSLGPREPDVQCDFLPDYVQWLKHPVLFRSANAHSDWRVSAFPSELPTPDPVDYAALELACGGYPWRWGVRDGFFVPSFQGCHYADLMLYRTLWENRVLSKVPPSLMVHGGCNVAGVSWNDDLHTADSYGAFQNAAGMVFYARQLAVVCRTTDWNQGAHGFGDAFGAAPEAVMGDGWKGIWTRLSADTVSATTQQKQAYLWNLYGDWTLRKSYPYTPASPPLNDDWEGAIALTNGVAFVMSTATATSVGDPVPECRSDVGKGVWFSYTPQTSRAVAVSTCGSGFDTVIQVCALQGRSPVPLAGLCDNDGGCDGYKSFVVFKGTAGTAYYILAAGFQSASGTLTVTASEVPVAIAAQPTGGAVNAGDTFTLKVSAAGTDLSYQWQLAGQPLPEATSPTLTLEDIAPSLAGDYCVVVTDKVLLGGNSLPVLTSVTSSVAKVTIAPALALALDNSALDWTSGGFDGGWYRETGFTCDGIDAARCNAPRNAPDNPPWLETGVSGPVTLSFYWCFATDLLDSTSDYLRVAIDGVEAARCSASRSLQYGPALINIPAGRHRVRWEYVRVGGGYGGAHLDRVTFTEGAPVVITTPPLAQTVVAGSNVILSVSAEGTAPLRHQWRRDGYDLAGATANALTLSQITPGQAGQYTVVVENDYGPPAISDSATLSVQTIPLAVALDCPRPEWTTSGNALWFGWSVGLDGVDAARSGVLGDGQKSLLDTTIPGPGVLSFYWRVSSETNADMLTFYVNKAPNRHISGEVDWQKVTASLPEGDNSVRWSYSKNVALSAGQDSGSVDRVRFEPSPRLTAMIQPDHLLRFSWPTGALEFQLQSTTNLAPPVTWDPAAESPVLVNQRWEVTVDPTDDSRFYRLAASLVSKVTLDLRSITDARFFNEAVALSGDYAFVTESDDELSVYSVSDPSHPGLASTLQLGGHTTGVTISGNYAYAAAAFGSTAGLRIVDISSPAAPVLVWADDLDYSCTAVAVQGGYAYVAAEDGLRIYNVQNPASAQPLAPRFDGGSGEGVAVSGEYVYLANGSDGLRVYRFQPPGTITPVAHFPQSAGVSGMDWFVTVSGAYAFVGFSDIFDYGLRIYDITDPASPQLVNRYVLPGLGNGVAVDGDLLYVPCSSEGLKVFDKSDIRSLKEVTTAPCTGAWDSLLCFARNVAVRGSFAYVVRSTDLAIYYINWDGQ